MDKRTLKAKEVCVGTLHKTNSCGICEVVDYHNSKKIFVKFLGYDNIVKCDLGNLRKGNVLNPLYPTFKGVGFLGIGAYKFTHLGLGSLWRSMILRCNLDNYQNRYKTYENVSVCKNWLNFQNFAEWCVEQKGFNCEDTNGRKFQLDKDLLRPENKVYSPEACRFVPNEINCFFQRGVGKRVNSMRGFRKVKSGKYLVRVGSDYLGTFDTKDEAKQVYQLEKLRRLDKLLLKYENDLASDLVEKLRNIEEIN